MADHAELTRPIIGIENRSAQEVFDIMADRIRHALRAQPAGVKVRAGELRRYIDKCVEMSSGGEYSWWSRLAEILSALEPAALSKQEAMPQLGGAPDDLRNCCAVLFEYLDIGQINEFTKKVLARRDPALASPAPAEPSAEGWYPRETLPTAVGTRVRALVETEMEMEENVPMLLMGGWRRILDRDRIVGWLPPAPHGEGA